MGRGIGPRRRWLVALVGMLLFAANARASDPRAVERFRAAAALQDRALYDLAAAEYAAIQREFAADSLADRARLARGICLFQLSKYADAQAELEPLRPRQPALRADECEQFLAYFGLAEYNLSRNAEAAQRDQLLDAAINALDEQLQSFPNGTLAKQTAFYHAEALYARGQLDAAVAAYLAFLAKYPEHPQRADALYALGVAEQERSDFSAAIQSFVLFRNEYPEHPAHADARSRHGDALLSLAESQFANEQPLEARRTVERLLAGFPESANVPPALTILAQIQLGRSELAAAEVSLDECLRRSTQPDVTIEARLLRARVRYERGNPSGSLADIGEVLARDPQRAEALHLRGLCEARLGKPAAAVRTLAQILAANPQYAAADRVLYDLAWAHEQSQEAEKALADYASLIELHPNSPLAPECQFRLGEASYAAGEFAQAGDRFRTAQATATDSALREKAAHKLAWCQFEQRDFATAQATFERQIADHAQGPLAADARAIAAECCFQRHQFPEALERFTASVNDRTTSASLRGMALVHAGEAAARLHHWPRSLELADRALAEFPTGDWADEAHCNRGMALAELGRLDEAQRELSAVAANHQGLLNVKAEFTLGRIHVARKEFDDAVRVFFKVAYGHGGTAAPVPIHPWQAEAIFAAARALEDAGRNDSARKLYQELVDSYPTSERTALARQSIERIMRR
jgi:TolA-binding protein